MAAGSGGDRGETCEAALEGGEGLRSERVK